jgi:GNAT superfamily N-acetyltransferase
VAVDVTRVTDLDGWSRSAPIVAEYVAWVLAELVARGAEVRADQAELVAAGFDAERDALLGPRGRLYLAGPGARPVGVVALKPVDAATAEVKRLYVTPAGRGQGVASSLMERVIADARALGYARARLETHRYMAGAIALYERLGFVATAPFAGFEGAPYGLGDETLFYALEL